MDSRIISTTQKPVTPRPALLIAEEPKCGPEPGKQHRCIRCHKLIANGELWRKVHAPDFSYAICIHTACMAL